MGKKNSFKKLEGFEAIRFLLNFSLKHKHNYEVDTNLFLSCAKQSQVTKNSRSR